MAKLNRAARFPPRSFVFGLRIFSPDNVTAFTKAKKIGPHYVFWQQVNYGSNLARIATDMPIAIATVMPIAITTDMLIANAMPIATSVSQRLQCRSDFSVAGTLVFIVGQA